MGATLGIADSYVKRCANKGLRKIREVPAARDVYYLTSKEFAEKARLTTTFLSTFLNFYRQAVEACTTLYRECEKRRWDSVVVCGVSDLAKIATMCSTDSAVEIVCAIDPTSSARRLRARPVVQE